MWWTRRVTTSTATKLADRQRQVCAKREERHGLRNTRQRDEPPTPSWSTMQSRTTMVTAGFGQVAAPSRCMVMMANAIRSTRQLPQHPRRRHRRSHPCHCRHRRHLRAASLQSTAARRIMWQSQIICAHTTTARPIHRSTPRRVETMAWIQSWGELVVVLAAAVLLLALPPAPHTPPLALAAVMSEHHHAHVLPEKIIVRSKTGWQQRKQQRSAHHP
mmetsp:Transcript_22278/g.63158  ORF Transcript_22278/g.63158 Transcript_22278/m.63158 type:complete len:217 (+) Transcript_22278:232-882(+)